MAFRTSRHIAGSFLGLALAVGAGVEAMAAEGSTAVHHAVVRGPAITAEAPETVSFLLGSCALQHPLLSERRNRIFTTMRRTPSDFMIWTGDNVYLLGRKQWGSAEGMERAYQKQRSIPEIEAFVRSRPQLAIWDDHDFGPNNADGHFPLKDNALAVFQKYWSNPYYGTEDQVGNFSHFEAGDASFFLLDGRFFRDTDDGVILGQAQLEWLKRGLAASTASFKFIVTASQALATNPGGDELGDAPAEKNALLDFIASEGISGVIFLSGDRHYTELTRVELPGAYPLYDFTCSPLTAVINRTGGGPRPNRVPGTLVRKHNFGRVTLEGSGEQRRCRIEVFDRKGRTLWVRVIALSELQPPADPLGMLVLAEDTCGSPAPATEACS